MKKEEICVLIDTPEKAKKAYDILTNAGEKIWEQSSLMQWKFNGKLNYLIFDKKDWLYDNQNDKTKISLNQLKSLLIPKEFAIVINNQDEYLKVKEVAEFLGYKRRFLYLGSENYILFRNNEYLSMINICPTIKIKSYTKFINKMPLNNNTVSIEIPLKYIPAIELILNELKQAEIKHPDFVESKYQLVSLLTEEAGEVAKDVNNIQCYKKELAQVGVLVLRGLSL